MIFLPRRMLLCGLLLTAVACQPGATSPRASDDAPTNAAPANAAPGADQPAADQPAADQPHENRLANETSPYLLLHAHNPVNWYPWGPEALAKAKEEDKVIFLSIGY